MCVVRAVVEFITVDEAYVYLKFISHRAFFGIFVTRYDSANHVLQTALAYISAHLLGPSEIGMRLPSMLAAPFYFAAAWRIAFLARRQFGFAILALGVMALNPLVLDHLSLARGYGIALTVFAWSLYFKLQYLINRDAAALIPAGVLLGLSIAANLTFLIPCIGLVIMMLPGMRFPLAIRYLMSAFVASALILAVPLVSARPSEFYFGADNAIRSIDTLSYSSLFYHGKMPLYSEWTAGYVSLLRFLDRCVIPLSLAGIALVLVVSFGTALVLRLIGGVLLVSVLLLGLGHALVGLKYAYDRTGLYLLFLFPLALIASVETCWERYPKLRSAAAPVIAVMTAGLAIYGLEFHIGGFAEWPFAADVRPYLEKIRARSPRGQIRIGGSGVFSYVIDFYREGNPSDWQPVFVAPPFAPGCDYYMLLPEDRERLDQLALHVLSETRDSILAVP